ncbi:MAG: Bax inhibitor-1/YccA family protein [Gammaproteobacteria bacterium]|nr:Bax inhibitor-1/YccA family protein [Gammaproteobacteria bacterium]
MNPYQQDQLKVAVTTGVESTFATTKLIRNTYTLLAVTLLFSAVMAGISIAIQPPGFTGIVSLLAALALIWLVLPKTANSTAGLGVVFAITGLMGFGLGPMLTYYLNMPGGGSIVMTALGSTATIFLSLSAYVMITKKDFTFMGGFLMTGMIVAIVCMLVLFGATLFGYHMPLVHLALSAMIAMLMAGFILYDTSRIINGGETNYIMATVGLYLSIYNLFVSLLHLIGAFNNDD